MKEILSSLVAEQQLLDQYLQSIPVRNWNTKTTFKNWTITEHVSYLAGLEDLAFNALKKKGTDFNKYRGPTRLGKFEKNSIAKGKDMRPKTSLSGGGYRGLRLLKHLQMLLLEGRLNGGIMRLTT